MTFEEMCKSCHAYLQIHNSHVLIVQTNSGNKKAKFSVFYNEETDEIAISSVCGKFAACVYPFDTDNSWEELALFYTTTDY